MIEVKNVSKIYGYGKRKKFCALNGINLTLPDCGLVALYGENGCGKTTLLNIISGNDRHYCGEVFYNGHNIENNLSALRRNVFSMVFQEADFIPYLNVAENIRLFSEEEGDDEVAEYLARYEVSDKKNNAVFELSGGQKQRISIIRGMIKRKCVFFVDEPTSNLSAEMEQNVFKQLRTLAKGSLVVLVSHNLALIRRYSDIIIQMGNGKLVCVENNCYNSIEYTDDAIVVPTNYYNLGAIDENEVKKRLNENGSLYVTVKNTENQIAPQTSHDENININQPYLKNKKLETGFKKNFIRKMLFHKLGASVVASFVLTVLLVAILLILLITGVDENRVVYNHLAKSEMQFIPFDDSYRIISKVLKTKKEFNNEEAETLREKVDTGIMWCSSLRLEPFCEGNVYFYSTEVNGIVFCHENDVSLVCGNYPAGKQILITDFLAKSIVNASDEYDSFYDILQNGITYYGRNLPVAGIIETNYERFLVTVSSENYDDSLYVDYEYCRDYFFNKIFYPLELLEKAEEIWFVFSDEINSFVDIIPYNEELVSDRLDSAKIDFIESNQLGIDGRIYLNQKWQQMQSDNLLSYLYNRQFVQAGTFESAAEWPIAMAGPGVIDRIKDSIAKQTSDYYLLNLKAQNDIINLADYDIHYVESGMEAVDDFVVDVYSITYNLYRFLIIVGIIVLLTTIIATGFILKSEQKTFAYMRVAGYSEGSRITVGGAKILLFFILTVLFTGILGIVTVVVVDGMLQMTADIDVNVLNVTPAVVLCLAFVAVGCFAISAIVNYLFIRKQDIVTLLSARKNG